jgi:hypothetical protein
MGNEIVPTRVSGTRKQPGSGQKRRKRANLTSGDERAHV